MAASNVKVDVWVRTICLALALINQVCVNLGYFPMELDDTTLYTLGSCLFTVATALAAWWKNNSFTPAAVHGDAAMEEYKRQCN